jgi:ATP-dependent helicase/nuclease subunit A
LKSGWNEVAQEWKSGDWTSYKAKEQPAQKAAMKLEVYQSSSWREKLVIRQTSRGFFESQQNDVVQKVRYGIHLHTVLSRIRYSDQLEEGIELIISEGLITHDEKPVIEKLMKELFDNPLISSWYTRTWDVRTEVPILLPGGFDSRIDRLMLAEGKAIVVDFKTGEPKTEDQKQVNEYIETLKKMDIPQVEGYLLYIKTGDVVSVPPGKVSKGKNKDEKQLGLGF